MYIFNCAYTWTLHLKATEFPNQAIWKVKSTWTPILILRLGISVYHGSLPKINTPLECLRRSYLTHHTSGPRGTECQGNMPHALRPPELLFLELINYSNLSFRLQIFKKSHGSQMEEPQCRFDCLRNNPPETKHFFTTSLSGLAIYERVDMSQVSTHLPYFHLFLFQIVIPGHYFH